MPRVTQLGDGRAPPQPGLMLSVKRPGTRWGCPSGPPPWLRPGIAAHRAGLRGCVWFRVCLAKLPAELHQFPMSVLPDAVRSGSWAPAFEPEAPNVLADRPAPARRSLPQNKKERSLFSSQQAPRQLPLSGTLGGWVGGRGAHHAPSRRQNTSRTQEVSQPGEPPSGRGACSGTFHRMLPAWNIPPPSPPPRFPGLIPTHSFLPSGFPRAPSVPFLSVTLVVFLPDLDLHVGRVYGCFLRIQLGALGAKSTKEPLSQSILPPSGRQSP